MSKPIEQTIAELAAMPWEEWYQSEYDPRCVYTKGIQPEEVCNIAPVSIATETVVIHNALPALLAHIAAQDARIAELEEAARWRDAAKELPESEEFVDVASYPDDGAPNVGMAIYRPHQHNWFGLSGYQFRHVRFWRPRPTAPEIGEVTG